MGLRGTIPPAGVDLLGAGPYHLPLPEGEGIAGGRCDGALIYKDFSGVSARLRRTGRRSSPLGNGAAIANVNATPRSNDELALPIDVHHRHGIHHRGILRHGIRQRNGRR
jgi:hypothetical protein